MSTPTEPSTSYLDLNGWSSNGYGNASLPVGVPAQSLFFPFPIVVANVALVLDRAQDPSELLDNLNWAERQKKIATLTNDNDLWSKYGADPTIYQDVINKLPKSVPQVSTLATFESTPSGYVSSAESRTIWVQVTTENFNDLFGNDATLMLSTGAQSEQPSFFWTGTLKLPDHVKGLYFDVDLNQLPSPVYPSAIAFKTLPSGPQGIGNASTFSSSGPTASPVSQIANYYNFPFASPATSPATSPLALLEPGSGNNDLSAPFSGPNVQGVQPGGTTAGDVNERLLDLTVANGVNPNSDLILYAGSGTNLNAASEPFTAYQSAFWDSVNNPTVVSSSYRLTASQASPNSPFMFAARELFVDAALHNISVFQSSGDGGSGYQIPNGITHVAATRASPYSVIVGGTSIRTEAIAALDSTIVNTYVAPALAGDVAILWQLIAGGLMTKPTADSPDWFVETVWNRYNVSAQPLPLIGLFSTGYGQNDSSNGGVDTTQPTPWYQSALVPLDLPETTDTSKHGRGLPDVSALASGNMYYEISSGSAKGDGGTSAATPLWASLALQINFVFHDQGLMDATGHDYVLGYMNDLLYIAAAISPGAFNDVTIGGNMSSYLLSTELGYLTSVTATGSGEIVSPTGYGYNAGSGFDLASGLGSPNGLLLARTLSNIAHHQMWFDHTHDVLVSTPSDGWTSGDHQDLLLQVSSVTPVSIGVEAGSHALAFGSAAGGTFAWTPRFAEQVLQSAFDPDLVLMFDKAPQGVLASTSVDRGDSVSVSINGTSGNGATTQLTGAYGFGDFQTIAGDVRVARPVAIAETADGASDQVAIVRVRQAGSDSLAVTFYKVDDLAGSIGALHPEDAGYAAAVAGRAYQLANGATTLAGPGYGKFAQSALLHVNAGDIIAMQLTDVSQGGVYSAFAKANEVVGGQHVGHLWNYGLNTWGWEDTWGGGDRDYNDLVVGLDFTSAAGHGYLV